MSNRFYVNDVQIFGNNEMFENTYAELEKHEQRMFDLQCQNYDFDYGDVKY